MGAFRQMSIVIVASSVVAACAGQVYLPNEAGGARSDISGADVRNAWLADHPDVSPEIADAIRDAIFTPGMSLEQRDVITNPNRKGATGNGFWRSRTTGDETRYQWFVSSQREPFVDGRGRAVCELVFVRDHLADVRYCPSSTEGADSG